MSDHGQKLQVIRKYLEEQFSGHRVEHQDRTVSRSPTFAVDKDDRHYELQVDTDFLSGASEEEVRRSLDHWRVRDELCRAEGLAVILTERGVRLVSSN